MDIDMDAVLALAVEKGLLNNSVFHDERKKLKNEGRHDDQSHHRSSEKKKQKDNDGGGSSNRKDKKKKKEEEKLEYVTVVMKIDFHCDGCRRRIFDAARSFRGAEYVKIEEEKNKLTVTGRVDPVKLHEKLERSLKKTIDLVSPQPKKNDKKKNNDEHNNKKPKQPPLTTVVLKMSLHCDGCCRRIRQIIRKTEGVHGLEINREKELVTIHGAVEAKEIQMRLKMKMKRTSEIVPAKKEKEKGGVDEKMMEQSNSNGEKNQKQQQQRCQKMCCTNNDFRGADVQMIMNQYESMYGYVPAAGYVVERLPAPQIFSDENPNACSVM